MDVLYSDTTRTSAVLPRSLQMGTLSSCTSRRDCDASMAATYACFYGSWRWELGWGGAHISGLPCGLQVVEVGLKQGTFVFGFTGRFSEETLHTSCRESVSTPGGYEPKKSEPYRCSSWGRESSFSSSCALPVSARLGGQPHRDLMPVALNVCPVLQTPQELFHHQPSEAKRSTLDPA